MWKRRFPILALKCRLKLENIQAVIIATAVLHNIARDMNLEEMDPEISISDVEQDNMYHSTFSTERSTERQLLINNFFNR